MSAIVWRWRLAWYGVRLGTGHPRVRAMFGRYVAARGGTISQSAGAHAHVAWCRAVGAAGFYNRSERKHLGVPFRAPFPTPSGTLVP